MKNLMLIDFHKPEHDLNQIELYYGLEKVNGYCGDNWDETPYEEEAGKVYEAYLQKTTHYKLTNCVALQPSDTDKENSGWCKNDLKEKLTPCLLLVPKRVFWEYYGFDINYIDNPLTVTYDMMIGHPQTVKIYYGDTEEEVTKKIRSVNDNPRIADEIDMWCELRGFKEHETAGDLAKSIIIESAELLENYQWSFDKPDTREQIQNVREEIADVMIYCIRLANHYHWNYEELITEKLRLNNRKYPVKEIHVTVDEDNKEYKELKQHLKGMNNDYRKILNHTKVAEDAEKHNNTKDGITK